MCVRVIGRETKTAIDNFIYAERCGNRSTRLWVLILKNQKNIHRQICTQTPPRSQAPEWILLKKENSKRKKCTVRQEIGKFLESDDTVSRKENDNGKSIKLGTSQEDTEFQQIQLFLIFFNFFTPPTLLNSNKTKETVAKRLRWYSDYGMR